MATEGNLLYIPGMSAGADLSTKQFHLMKLDSSARAVAAAAASDELIGVLQDKPSAANQAAAVAYSGKSKVAIGDTVSIGDKLYSDGNGKGIPFATAAGDTDWIIGIALEAGVNGDIISVQLNITPIQVED